MNNSHEIGHKLPVATLAYSIFLYMIIVKIDQSNYYIVTIAEKIACNDKIYMEEKIFCCEGCKMVYQIINQNDLCDYYNLNESPGINQRISGKKRQICFPG